MDITKAAFKEAMKPEGYKKGDKFEDYVLSLFSASKKWHLLKRTQDYDHNSQMYEKSSLEPDFRFKHLASNAIINIECKYRASLYNGMLEWCKREQLIRYKDGDKYNNTFIIIGYGGQPNNPEKIYLFKLSEVKYEKLYPSILKDFEIEKGCCFDMKNNQIIQQSESESQKALFNRRLEFVKNILKKK